MNIKYLYFIILFILLYITISFFEWSIHYYYMHQNNKIGKYLYNITKSAHIEHHKQTNLDQNNNGNEKELVFQLFQPNIIFIILLLMIIFYGIWHLIPEFKKIISIKNLLLIVFISMFIYIWSWNSLHTKYHSRKVSLKNQQKYNLIPFFNPDTNSRIYKYLFSYHTLHHLNKGKYKGNYNILCPLFDNIFNTYKSKVDNTLYFLENKPKTKQEKWLYNNQIFEIRIQENNIIEYKLKNSDSWLIFPFNV